MDPDSGNPVGFTPSALLTPLDAFEVKQHTYREKKGLLELDCYKTNTILKMILLLVHGAHLPTFTLLLDTREHCHYHQYIWRLLRTETQRYRSTAAILQLSEATPVGRRVINATGSLLQTKCRSAVYWRPGVMRDATRWLMKTRAALVRIFYHQMFDEDKSGQIDEDEFFFLLQYLGLEVNDHLQTTLRALWPFENHQRSGQPSVFCRAHHVPFGFDLGEGTPKRVLPARATALDLRGTRHEHNDLVLARSAGVLAALHQLHPTLCFVIKFSLSVVRNSRRCRQYSPINTPYQCIHLTCFTCWGETCSTAVG